MKRLTNDIRLAPWHGCLGLNGNISSGVDVKSGVIARECLVALRNGPRIGKIPVESCIIGAIRQLKVCIRTIATICKRVYWIHGCRKDGNGLCRRIITSSITHGKIYCLITGRGKLIIDNPCASSSLSIKIPIISQTRAWGSSKCVIVVYTSRGIYGKIDGWSNIGSYCNVPDHCTINVTKPSP